MKDIDKLFYELVRVAIGTSESLSHTPSQKEWKAIYYMAMKQSLVGICFAGLRRLGADADEGFVRIGMSEMSYFTWMGMAVNIQQRNEHMDGYTNEVLAHFRNEGFPCQVLKGQGIASLYGSLAGLRQSGDVDVWVAGDRKALYEHSVKKFGKLEGLTYHHVHYPMYDTTTISAQATDIEAHVWPSFLSSPLRNKRLQEFCMMYEPKDGCEDIPSLAFNRVFILLHCYQHFTRRGVGMRQLLDYYFVLIRSYENHNENYKDESMKWISDLGMKRFAEAMMWVMTEVFGLDEQCLLCDPNAEYGRFLLDEVMKTGNMGHADDRVDKIKLQSACGRYLNNLKRDTRIVKICPHEALWEPLWGIYQFAWCKLTKMKYK